MADSHTTTLGQTQMQSGISLGECAIALHGVSKRFKLYQNPVTGPLKELLLFWKARSYYTEFLAVNDASLRIRRGEVVGIIGPNGAGKTTLLKMIAGLLPADKGTVSVRGKVTAVLALGVGVHPEFTGRENIYYGGLLLGMTSSEIRAKTQSIIDFAELGEYIDQPFRTYSAGMKARLLFSVAMSVDPDIFIVDEALATGDAYFVDKCLARIREICTSGATVLFVSHNLSQVGQLCGRAVFMANGRICLDGTPAEVMEAYNLWVFDKEKKLAANERASGLKMISGSGEVEVDSVSFRNAEGETSTGFYSGEDMEVEIHYSSSLPPGQGTDLFVGFLLGRDMSYIAEVNTANLVDQHGSAVRSRSLELNRRGVIRLRFSPLLLLNNHYALWIIFYAKDKGYYCEYKNVAPFFVARRDNTWMRGDAYFWQFCTVTSEPSE